MNTASNQVFSFFLALNQAAVSINLATPNWLDVGGALIVAPGTVGYVCGSAVLTTLAAAIASILPARRAARVDPVEAIGQ